MTELTSPRSNGENKNDLLKEKRPDKMLTAISECQGL